MLLPPLRLKVAGRIRDTFHCMMQMSSLTDRRWDRQVWDQVNHEQLLLSLNPFSLSVFTLWEKSYSTGTVAKLLLTSDSLALIVLIWHLYQLNAWNVNLMKFNEMSTWKPKHTGSTTATKAKWGECDLRMYSILYIQI